MSDDDLNAPGLTIRCEIYEHEIDRIQDVLSKLNEKTGRYGVDRDAWDREAQDRFAGIGFKVSILWHYTNIENCYLPEITMYDRTEPITWDPDRQVHEVTNDYLGLGEGGVIKTKSGLHVVSHHRHGGHHNN